MSALFEKIKSRGYWRVVVRPADFDAQRIPYGDLLALAERSSVQLRGWDFPHIDRRSEPLKMRDWVGQDTDWNHHVEHWRLYQSGQFVILAGLWSDWRDQSDWWPANTAWKAGAALGIGDTIYRLTEVFEFAARLSATSAGSAKMHVAWTLYGLRGRELAVDHPRRWPMHERYVASIPEFGQEKNLAGDDLRGNVKALAVASAYELFCRFGWNPRQELLSEWQSELGRV